METYISLLRGVNVGGQRKIRMKDLADAYESLGFKNVRTYLQSGNAIFGFALNDAGKLSSIIEAGIRQKFGFPVKVLIRNVNELQLMIKSNPFLKRKGIDAEKLHVTFLSADPGKEPALKLDAGASGTDEFRLSGKEIYLFCPNGYGRTKLSNNFFEKRLGVTATTRNWNTVQTLLEIACHPSLDHQD